MILIQTLTSTQEVGLTIIYKTMQKFYIKNTDTNEIITLEANSYESLSRNFRKAPYKRASDSEANTKELIEAKEDKISQIKSKAQQLIVAQYPDYKQRNILMSGDEIAIADMNAFIEPIRIRSNKIESDINDCTTIEELNNVNTDF